MPDKTQPWWYICHCKPQMELKAKINAQENGWEVFLPWFKEPASQPGRAPRWRPLLPGYMFATGAPFLSVYALRNPMYVNRILDDGAGLPYRLTEGNEGFAALMARAKPNGFVADAVRPLCSYGEGDQVLIEAGIWGDVPGEVVKIGKTRTTVRASVGGKAVSLHKVKHEQVKQKVVA